MYHRLERENRGLSIGSSCGVSDLPRARMFAESRIGIRGGIGLFTDLYPAFIVDRFLSNVPNVSTFDASSGLIATDINGGGPPQAA